MITNTSEIAIQALLYLASRPDSAPVAPAQIAEIVGCSHSYLRKITGMLAKAGLIEGHRGPLGGVRLLRAPAAITLLDVVEACQGLLIGAYCHAIGDELGPTVCAYHRAMWEIRTATRETMRRWTLADLRACPLPRGPLADNRECRMDYLRAVLPASPRHPRVKKVSARKTPGAKTKKN